MRLTVVLNNKPKFRYWRDFGAGRPKRMPYFKHWRHTWRTLIAKDELVDHTLTSDELPPGSRLLDAEDLMDGPIDALPDEIIRRKEEKVIYDHPWPFNVKLDPIKNQKLMYCYSIFTRFYVPRDDALVLTNTILETDSLEAHPPIEPTAENVDYMERQYEWATEKDSVLVRQPATRSFPKINIRPSARYGISKERQEFNIVSSMQDYAQMLLAKHYQDNGEQDRLREIIDRRHLAFPHCRVPFSRESHFINLDLVIDSLSLSQSALPPLSSNPQETCQQPGIDISPRSWRSLLEQSRQYTPEWSFTLPRSSHLHTIQLTSRILRTQSPDEMLARSIIHGFGLTSQFARLRAHESQPGSNSPSCVLEDPLAIRQVNDKDLLDKPIVLQIIGFQLPERNYYFTRYQLNTLNFNDRDPSRVKNQAWHSGPISDLTQALRYYLDFQSFHESKRGN